MDTCKTDITAFGELLIDFTDCGNSFSGMRLFEQNPGGAPANVLACAAGLGAKTAFIGKVGHDMHGAFLKQTLMDLRTDVSALLMTHEAFTTLAFVALDAKGERTFSFARQPGADTLITPAELPEEILKNTNILAIGTLSLTAEPSASAERAAVRMARSNGSLIALDMNYRASLWESEDRAIRETLTLLHDVDVLKTSAEESEMLTGERDPLRAARKLLTMGPRLVAVTLGDKGAWLINSRYAVFEPAFSVRSEDTTGAGDAFWGALLVKIRNVQNNLADLNEDKMKEILLFAEASGACCTMKRGAIPAMPSERMIEALLNNRR